MEKQSKIEDGYLIETYSSGHVVRMPVQTEIAKEPEPVVASEIDINTLSDKDFKIFVLEKLGYTVKK